jgi:hypothetical protein
MTDLVSNYKTIGQIDETKYNETRQAEPTSRVLDGSSDHGYYMEYTGYGTAEFNGKTIEVKAVYLFDDDARGIEEDNLDWFEALKRFELID